MKEEIVTGEVYDVNTKFSLAHFRTGNGDVHCLAPFTPFADGKELKDVKLGQKVSAKITREPTKVIEATLL